MFGRRAITYALALALLSLLVPVVSVSAQSGTITVLFNADTRPQVPIMQFNPYPHEGIFATCSLLGAESSVYLQISVDGIMSSQQQCDVTIELHGLQGHSIDISAQDVLGVGPIFHLLVYGLDPSSATATPTATIPFGCVPQANEDVSPDQGFTWTLAYSAHHVWPHTTGPGTTLPYGPLNAATGVVVELRNFTSTTGGYSSYLFSDVDGVNDDAWHLLHIQSAPDPANVYYYFSGVNQTSRIYHYPQGGGDVSVTEADVCVWIVNPTGTATPTAPPTATPGTPTPLGTPPPSFGGCVYVNAFLIDGSYSVRVNGDMFERFWRIESGDLPVYFTFLSFSGTRSIPIATRNWQVLTIHTSFTIWTSPSPFELALCAPQVVISTTTPTIDPFATQTPTRTASPTRTPSSTPTGTLTPLPTPTVTNTPTVVPSTTPNATCLTPDGEDEAECIIIGLEQTQISLQQTLAAPIQTPLPLNLSTSTPVLNETVVAVIDSLCAKDPCYNMQKFRDTVTISLNIFAEVDASQCHQLAFPFDFGGGQFTIAPEMNTVFGDTICWFVDLTTPIRNIMRFLSVIGVFFMLWRYYVRTMRRLGDV